MRVIDPKSAVIGALGMLLILATFGFRPDTDELGHLTVRSLTIENDRGVIMTYLGNGYMQTYNEFSEPTLFIGTGKDGGGLMRTYNGSGDESAYLGTGRLGGGYVRTYNNSGKETTYLGTGSDNSGQLRIYTQDGETASYLGNGFLQSYNKFGERTLSLGADANNSGGYLKTYNFDGTQVKHQITKVSKEFADVYKGDYAHFTLKEISEQPDTIMRAGSDEQIDEMVKHIRDSTTLYITGSGTSYNSSRISKYLMSKYAKLKIEPIISSELQFAPDSIEKDSTLIAISQSGESADVLEAVKIAKQSNAKILSIVNHLNSSLSQESDVVVGLNCGPEIGVAATKSFTSQLAILYKITNKLCDGCMKLDWDNVSKSISEILENHSKIQELAKILKDVSDIYILGRGIHFPIAKEAALKLKELTYIHAEGIPGGELKHGPLALMDENVFVIIINPDDSTYTDTINSASEIKARGAKIIGISDKKSDIYDYWIEVPKIEEAFYPLIEIIPIQLLAYYAALEKNTDPDYPRNLAKSVTVK